MRVCLFVCLFINTNVNCEFPTNEHYSSIRSFHKIQFYIQTELQRKLQDRDTFGKYVLTFTFNQRNNRNDSKPTMANKMILHITKCTASTQLLSLYLCIVI